MPITNQDDWNTWVDSNRDPYGKACVDVAREVMRILDSVEDFDTYKIICDADRNIKAGGITGFMAGCVAKMVSSCHSRGEEFRTKWNTTNQLGTEGDRANESGGILNPAIIEIDI